MLGVRRKKTNKNNMIVTNTINVQRPGLTQIIVTLCDEELVGKEFDEFYVSPKFYGGQKKTEKEILQDITNAGMINALGKESIDFLIKNHLITEESVVLIKKIPHAQVFML